METKPTAEELRLICKDSVYHVDGAEYNVDEQKLAIAFHEHATNTLTAYKEELRERIEVKIKIDSKWPIETQAKRAALSRLKWVLSLLSPPSNETEP